MLTEKNSAENTEVASASSKKVETNNFCYNKAANYMYTRIKLQFIDTMMATC